MIDTGDVIIIKACCLNRNDENYVFTVLDFPIEETSINKEGALMVNLTQTDKVRDQEIHDALEKLKSPE